ncbi:3-hydroxyacyl-CoA dehydrogenase [Fructilactobacillus sanfranciscensis]|uniref:3-hydroxyacyl-CoA dehydrogenase n=1 Tax=Fructilactobacillus sanfranciscensis TaxID=1625 RepID=UPI000CD480E0|nr:3-hydroxyacyl-CoA dehydrogenase [Fructilactobacillus sanfranciscensis]NDR69372.1 3-hydroxyacyl-CoA dehydrogenase [Fructilactobacillus sanfranciscensis]NDS15980.1 3-hydroxyacyl-CoA dehydrogenase [Fructilactobacillus sanfranciscensis]POH21079.1 3-hydroxybutyryl-CoA dehydrogenase [Fructilactobacillus sanfranciscensis]
MEFNNVTVIGGGTLGSQIAYMSAFHGKNVTIWGRKESSLDSAKERVSRWAQAVKEDLGATEHQLNDAQDHLTYTTDLSQALKDADLVIEALPENVEIKKDFYEKFAKLADPKTIVATNTSTLLPSQFADYTGRPDKFLAYHFANEIWKNNTAEIMSQSKTSKELPKMFEKYSREIGMVPLLVNKEQPGYILNSLLVPFLTAGVQLWVKGISDPQTIDKTWMIATGSPMGPFAFIDMIGLRTVYEINKMTKDSTSQKAAELLKKMIDKGEIGVESGKGFYTYPHPDFKKAEFLK